MTLKVTFIVKDTANQGREIQSFYKNLKYGTFSKLFHEKFQRNPIESFRYDNIFT